MSERDTARDLLAAWALDAVDDVERAIVERSIREDPALADEARALQETAARLATAAATPPPAALRGEVLTAIDDVPQKATTSSSARRRRAPRAVSGWWRLAAAAVFAVAVAVPSVVAVQQAERAERAEQQAQSLSEAMTRPGAELLAAGVDGGGRAVAVVSAEGAVFAARDLPVLGPEHDYQLWVVDDRGPASAGLLATQDGQVSARMTDFGQESALAVTVEPAGGSEAPTTDPVVVLAGP